MSHRSGILAVLIATIRLAAAGNPIVNGIGLTDPHVVIHEDQAYVFATHDDSAGSNGFVMKNWWVWRSPDLVRWEQVGTLKPEDTFLHRPFNDCWATFGGFRNSKCYWYFSAGPTEIGVAVADSAAGPWHDPLGKPLVPKGLTPTEQRDPDILLDDDGNAYMVFGTFHYFLARLNNDMISLAEAPRRIVIDHEFGPYGEGKTDDKPSLHKRNGLYYLSWSGFYAVSHDVHGPYSYRGSVITPANVAPELSHVPGADIWHDRHGNFFTWHGQWYYACNDKSLPGRSEHFRDSFISYVHYRDNGDIAPIRLDRTGVGQYDAASGRIEAEDFFAIGNGEVRECPGGGFAVRGLGRDSKLSYPNIMNLPGNAICKFRGSSHAAPGARIEVREAGSGGRLLGTCAIPDTGAWDNFAEFSCKLSNQPGNISVIFCFAGQPGETVRLDWFEFSGDPAAG